MIRVQHKLIKKLAISIFAVTLLFAMCIASNATTCTLVCSQYPVHCSSTRTSSSVTGVTGFTAGSLGGTQRVSVTVNSVIQATNGTGASKAGKSGNAQSVSYVSKTYTCPSGYKVIKGTTTHTATYAGDTEQKTLTASN